MEDGDLSPVVTCPNGHENAPGALFCSTCGAALGGSAADGRRSRRRRWPAAAAVLVVILAGAVFLIARGRDNGGPKGSTSTITGTLTLHQVSLKRGLCTGTGGFDDLRYGAQVVVKDGAGKIIATSSLGSGDAESSSAGVGYYCVFQFHVDNVPAADFYSVEVTHRGAVSYARPDLEKNGWHVTMSIG